VIKPPSTERRWSGALAAGALFGAAVFATACAPVLLPGPAAPATVQLSAEDIGHAAELLRMEDARVFDEPLVARLLADPLPEIRGRAVLAAGRVRDRSATPLLLRAAEDPVASVRTRAALALGLMADSAAEVVTTLNALTRDADPAAAAEAAAALGRLGVEAGRPALQALLDAPTLPAAVRQEALLAVWRLPRSGASADAPVRLLADADPETRWRAAYVLMRIGGTASVPALIGALGDADDRVRANAARGLRMTLADSAGMRADALAALLTAADDPHPHVRINALRLLPSYRDNARAMPVLLRRLADPDPNVAVAAAAALADTGEPAAAAALGRAVNDLARPDGLRTSALAAWVRLDPAAAVPAAGTWADSARWILRYHAARSLGTAPWPQPAAVLERLTRDTSRLVAAEAFTALRAAADSLPEARRIYIQGLGAGDLLVRAAALRGLARHATVADLDLLLQAYARAQQDDANDAAIAALEALGRLRAAGVTVEHAFHARFGTGPAPRDPALHRAVVQHIGAAPPAWGAPRTAPEPRPLEFYADVVRRLVAPVLAGAAAPRVAIGTAHGEIVLELAAADAPLTVHNFLSLVDRGYYAGTRWHRVVPNFVIQDGDPRGDGSGGPGHAIRDEINALRYVRGALGMALSGPDTGGSQFFITHSPQPHLDGGYTIFGRVADGMDVVDRVVQEDPITHFRRLD
jgi:cyclophilin family peptidyl-prolyl cis-trans isomerase/HEAT repeat protein